MGYTFAARYALDPTGRLTAETIYLPQALSKSDAAALARQRRAARRPPQRRGPGDLNGPVGTAR